MTIDRDPAIQERQMDEVLKSIGITVNVARCVIAGVDFPVPVCEHDCDENFYVAEGYLAANQAALAATRFRRAIGRYRGESAIRHFTVAVRLGLAEALSAVDVRDWDSALLTCDEVLGMVRDDDRALAIKARVYFRQRNLRDSYDAAKAALISNAENFEAACYLGLAGFSLARDAGNVEEMYYSIQNLRSALRLFPSAEALKELIAESERELRRLTGSV